MLTSKLYGQVVLIALRPASQLTFTDLTSSKYQDWQKNTETVDVPSSAPPMVVKGITMPARKEKLTIHKHENLCVLDMSPSLRKGTVYQHVRSSQNPLKALTALITQITGKAQQTTIVVDRLELLVSLIGQLPTLDLVK